MVLKFNFAVVLLAVIASSFSQNSDKRVEAQKWIETEIPKAFNSQLNPIES